MIVFGALVPHPPILIPGIGKGEEQKIEKTSQAMEKLAEDLAKAEPDTIIFITPHTLLYPDMFNICGMEKLFGNFQDFDFSDFQWEGKNNLELAHEISDQSESEGIPALLYDNGEDQYQLDHGILVPLYFLSQKMDNAFKVLPIGYTYGTRSEHYIFGQIISEIAEKREERVAVIASGDLSHRLLDIPKGEPNVGAIFDQKFLEALKEEDSYSVVNMDHDLVDGAGECGFRSSLVLLGALSDRIYKTDIYSYEGPFGVGYSVVNFRLDKEVS